MFSLGKKEGESRMKVLITLQRSKDTRRYLINLLTKSIISQVRDHISTQEYNKALDLVYYGGLVEKEIAEEDIPAIKADLMLSERSANWDIKR